MRKSENDVMDRNLRLEKRLIRFSVSVLKCIRLLPKRFDSQHIAKQLMRSSTSPAANYGEAQAAESRIDFIHKLRISLKELRETRVWLIILYETQSETLRANLTDLINESDQLISIFVTSLKTATKNISKYKR